MQVAKTILGVTKIFTLEGEGFFMLMLVANTQ